MADKPLGNALVETLAEWMLPGPAAILGRTGANIFDTLMEKTGNKGKIAQIWETITSFLGEWLGKPIMDYVIGPILSRFRSGPDVTQKAGEVHAQAMTPEQAPALGLEGLIKSVSPIPQKYTGAESKKTFEGELQKNIQAALSKAAKEAAPSGESHWKNWGAKDMDALVNGNTLNAYNYVMEAIGNTYKNAGITAKQMEENPELAISVKLLADRVVGGAPDASGAFKPAPGVETGYYQSMMAAKDFFEKNPQTQNAPKIALSFNPVAPEVLKKEVDAVYQKQERQDDIENLMAQRKKLDPKSQAEVDALIEELKTKVPLAMNPKVSFDEAKLRVEMPPEYDGPKQREWKIAQRQ